MEITLTQASFIHNNDGFSQTKVTQKQLNGQNNNKNNCKPIFESRKMLIFPTGAIDFSSKIQEFQQETFKNITQENHFYVANIQPKHTFNQKQTMTIKKWK